MKIETHLINHLKIAEIITDQVILSTPEEGLDLLGNLYYQGFDGIMIHKENITSDFFDLKTKNRRRNPSEIRTIPDAADYYWRFFSSQQQELTGLHIRKQYRQAG